jgi:hypothetical protein
MARIQQLYILVGIDKQFGHFDECIQNKVDSSSPHIHLFHNIGQKSFSNSDKKSRPYYHHMSIVHRFGMGCSHKGQAIEHLMIGISFHCSRADNRISIHRIFLDYLNIRLHYGTRFGNMH